MFHFHSCFVEIYYFFQWLLARPFSDDQRNILSDAVCFLLLTPMAVGAAYLCILGGR